MEHYQVFYRQTQIGTLTIDPATGMYHYEADASGVEEVLALTPLPPEMQTGTHGFGPPIPFLQNRIMNLKRSGLAELNYQTDYFLIRACP